MPAPAVDPRPTQPRPSLRPGLSAEPSRTPLDVLVIGAGQAGLAVGHHLAAQRLRFLLVDGAPEIGHSWRTRWDSLRLFTPAEFSALPGMAFPAAAGTYPGKDQVADYLSAYAARFDLPVMLNTRVEHVDRTDAGPGSCLFRVVTSQGTLWARQVVVATGPFQLPDIPSIGRSFDASVTQLHSAAYRNPTDLPAGRVVVVGAGNSGLQIALELAGTHEVHLAVGTRQKAVPQRPLGRDLFWWLTRSRLIARPATSPVAALLRRRGELVIGTTWADLDAAGVTVHARLTGAESRTAGFADGTDLDDVAAVVWATGFRSDYSWLEIPGLWSGTEVQHTRGRASTPGLWFIGLPWQHTRGSALLGFVGADAAWVAAGVADHHETGLSAGRAIAPAG
jgi:putative flavoprotein involved in K+ transport